jgi:hypothetical protein
MEWEDHIIMGVMACTALYYICIFDICHTATNLKPKRLATAYKLIIEQKEFGKMFDLN